jgi:hypothetical protein
MHPFVEGNTTPGQRIDNKLFGSLHKTGLIGVFNPQNKGAPCLSGQQIIEQGGSHPTGV